MTAALRVPRPGLGVDLRGHFDELVQRGDLKAVLDLSVTEFDELALLSEVAVSAVELSDNGIAVNYVVSWAAFHACDDRRFGGRHARVLRGRAQGGDWVFERPEPAPASRDTLDEF